MTDKNADGYIYIPNWDDFQHYSDRRPTWIKLYVDLLDNDDFLALPFSARGVLVELWILTARVGLGRVSASTTYLRRALQPSTRSDSAALPRTLELLNHAGLIEVRASKALAVRYQRASPDLREEKNKKKNARALADEESARRAEIKRQMAAVELPEGWGLAKTMEDA